MNAATSAKRRLNETKLLILGPDKLHHRSVGQIGRYLNSGDVMVVNDSATLPSSFFGHIHRSQAPIEIRLASYLGRSPENHQRRSPENHQRRSPESNQRRSPEAGDSIIHDLRNWMAVSFGAGSWRDSTEYRGLAPQIFAGDRIRFGKDLEAVVLNVQHERLLQIQFVSPDLIGALYRYGRPIQYSYLKTELKVWDQQTIFAGVPISVEPPSAGFPFSWKLIFELKEKGVLITKLTHGAGISSTGSKHLDELLPLAEWYSVPRETAKLVNQAVKEGRRVLALGTTVLRALESSIQDGQVVASSGLTHLKITPDYQIQSATSLLTGMHALGSSHMEILKSFSGREAVDLAYQEAKNHDYLEHEYGDVSLLDSFARMRANAPHR